MRLRIIGPQGDCTDHDLGQKTSVRIGRSLDNDLVLESKTVSRHHCLLSVDESGTVTVEDLESRYGVRVEADKVRRVAVVAPGDRFSLGSWWIEVLGENTVTVRKADRVDFSDMSSEPTLEMPLVHPDSGQGTNRHVEWWRDWRILLALGLVSVTIIWLVFQLSQSE